MGRGGIKEGWMAMYTCTTQEGRLSAEQRAGIAQEIPRIHSTHTGEPAGFVWVLFETLSPDSIYAGGKSGAKPAVKAVMVGLFRENRRTEVKTQVLNELWSMYKNVTGLSHHQISVSLTVLPHRDSMF